MWKNGGGYPDPYDYHIGYELSDTPGYVTLKGFKFTDFELSEYKEVIRAVNYKLGLLVEYDRFHRAPHMKSVQVDPRLTGGRILMSKIAIPHTDEAKHDDGSINHTVMDQHIEVVREAVRRGQLKIVTMGETEVVNEQDLPDLDDLLDNDQLKPGDKIYIFCARAVETGPGRTENHPAKA